MVVVLGDTSIRAFQSSGILETNLNIGVVLASTERATIGALEQQGGFRSRFPERVFPVYLKPAPDDPVSARPEMAPWVTPRPGVQHLRGGAEGALDRPDAATRLLLSHEFRSALNNGLDPAHARRPRGNHLAVAVTCFAVAGRMTGSGTLVAALDVLEDALIDFAGRADEVWIDALIGTASIHQHAKREFEDAEWAARPSSPSSARRWPTPRRPARAAASAVTSARFSSSVRLTAGDTPRSPRGRRVLPARPVGHRLGAS